MKLYHVYCKGGWFVVLGSTSAKKAVAEARQVLKRFLPWTQRIHIARIKCEASKERIAEPIISVVIEN